MDVFETDKRIPPSIYGNVRVGKYIIFLFLFDYIYSNMSAQFRVISNIHIGEDNKLFFKAAITEFRGQVFVHISKYIKNYSTIKLGKSVFLPYLGWKKFGEISAQLCDILNKVGPKREQSENTEFQVEYSEVLCEDLFTQFHVRISSFCDQRYLGFCKYFWNHIESKFCPTRKQVYMPKEFAHRLFGKLESINRQVNVHNGMSVLSLRY